MSAVRVLSSPQRIKASHRRRWKGAAGRFVQRYYDPVCGCFLSPDPVQANPDTGASFNRYDYANDNPYKFTDPDGRDCTGTHIVSTCSNGGSAIGMETSARGAGTTGDASATGNSTNAGASNAPKQVLPRAVSGVWANGGGSGSTAQGRVEAIEEVCIECYFMGTGRLAYAGLAKAIPTIARTLPESSIGQAAYANAARNSLKDLFRGPLAPFLKGWRQPTLAQAFARYGGNSEAIISAAGRTSGAANAAGAAALAAGVANDARPPQTTNDGGH